MEITVILPTFNRRDVLPRALDCLMRQTFRDWRLLVVNDGGDDVADLIAACGDSRLEYHDRPHLGKAAQLNYALGLVTSKYVAYMDDDDTVFPEHLEKLHAAAERMGADFVYSDTYETVVGADGKVISRKTGNRLDATFENIRLFNAVNHKQILHTKALSDRVGGYDEEMRILIDFDYIKRLLKVSERPFHVREVTGEHFLKEGAGGRYASISGLWKRDPEAAGRSLLRFFGKDPAALARLYRQANDDRLELRRLRLDFWHVALERLWARCRVGGDRQLPQGRFFDALQPDRTWRDITPEGGFRAAFALADESVPAVAALNGIYGGGYLSRRERRVVFDTPLPLVSPAPRFSVWSAGDGIRVHHAVGTPKRWVVLTSREEFPEHFALEFDYVPHAEFKEQLQIDFRMESLADRLRILVRDNRVLCLNAVERGRFRADAKAIPCSFPLGRPTRVRLSSSAGVFAFAADGQTLVSAEYHGVVGRRRHVALVFFEPDPSKEIDFEIANLKIWSGQ